MATTIAATISFSSPFLYFFKREGTILSALNFRKLISDNDTATFRCGLVVFIGLAIETAVEFYFRKDVSYVEISLRLIANILVAGGVLGEVIFAHRVSKEAKEQQRKSDEKIADLNKIAADARERAALLEQLTAFRHIPEDRSKLVEFLTDVNSRTPLYVQVDLREGYQLRSLIPINNLAEI